MEIFQSNNGGSINLDAALVPKDRKHKPKKLIYHQIIAFSLTGLLYCFIHSLRTVWAYSKPYLSDSNSYYSTNKLGALDFAFMLSYAFGQYVNGWLGDRINLKIFLSAGTACAILGICLFGILEGFASITNIYVDVLLFILNGLGQSIGYPACVSIVTHWFSPNKIGLVFGFWGTNLNIGNIIGQQIGRATIENGLGWQYSLFFASVILAVLLIGVLIFVRTHPKDLEEKIIKENAPEGQTQRSPKARGISFFEAWKLEHIPIYALGFFCVKGVMYGVMFWLPFYLTKEVGLTGDISLILASIEIGMIIGSIVIGFGSDRLKSRGIAIMAGFYFAVIFLILTFVIKGGEATEWLYFVLLLAAGFGIGGPNSLIGSAVSADIGHTLAKENINATSTITGIMEGCGALGAALTQLLVSWFTGITFPFFAFLCFAGGCLMIPIARQDFMKRRREKLNLSVESSDEV